MALRLILLVAGCAQLSLANPCSSQVAVTPGCGSWVAVPAPDSSAWNVPASYPKVPGWNYAPAGANVYGTVSPWKTPAPVSAWNSNAHSWNSGASEHPWTNPAIAPNSVNTGSPSVVGSAPQESSNYNNWSEKNTQNWNIPSAASSAASAEQSAAQLSHSAQLPSPPQLPIPPSCKIPSIHLPSSSLAKHHPLQTPGVLHAQYGPGTPPYAPIQIPHSHPAPQFGPGTPPYAPIQYTNYAATQYAPGLPHYAPFATPYSAFGAQYNPGFAPFAPFGSYAPYSPNQFPQQWFKSSINL